MHYLVTSQNYREFIQLQHELESVSTVDNITELCSDEAHPWYQFITPNVANIIRKEVIFLALLSVFTVVLIFNFSISSLAVMGFFSLFALFSLWLCGLIGWHLIHLYSVCKSTLGANHNQLVMLVGVPDDDNEIVIDILKAKPNHHFEIIDA